MRGHGLTKPAREKQLKAVEKQRELEEKLRKIAKKKKAKKKKAATGGRGGCRPRGGRGRPPHARRG